MATETVKEPAPQTPPHPTPPKPNTPKPPAPKSAKNPGAKASPTPPLTFKTLPWGLIRCGAILLCAAVLVWRVYPLCQDFVTEAQYSKAASKARVLQQGAQQVATQRLSAGDSHQAAAQYLSAPEHLKEITEAAGFPVDATAISSAQLSDVGLLSAFGCTIVYDQQSYTVTFDIAGHSGSVLALESASKAGDDK